MSKVCFWRTFLHWHPHVEHTPQAKRSGIGFASLAQSIRPLARQWQAERYSLKAKFPSYQSQYAQRTAKHEFCRSYFFLFFIQNRTAGAKFGLTEESAEEINDVIQECNPHGCSMAIITCGTIVLRSKRRCLIRC